MAAKPLEYVGGITPTHRALYAAAMSGKLASIPEFQRDLLAVVNTTGGPVDQIVKSMEALYAVFPELNVGQTDLLFQLASCVAESNFYGKGERAHAIIAACRRKAGESTTPPAEQDPEPDPEYVEPEEVSPDPVEEEP